MSIDLITLIILSLGVLIGVSLTLGVHRFTRRIRELETQVADLHKVADRKHHTNRTDAGLLDLLAEINRITFDLDEMEARLHNSRRLASAAHHRLGIIRQGPYAYDPDMESEI